MAFDRQGTGLVVIRTALGVFLCAEGVSKVSWLADGSVLAARLAGWLATAPAGSVQQWYLAHVCVPGAPVFARVVPLAECGAGLALLLGVATPTVAWLAAAMVLNFQVANGMVSSWSYLTNGYGLPVLGPLVGLGLGGARLPWSFRR